VYGGNAVRLKLLAVEWQTLLFGPSHARQPQKQIRIPISCVLKLTSKAMKKLDDGGSRLKLVISTRLKAKWLKPLREFFPPQPV